MNNQPWPTYSDADGNYVTALPIKKVNQAVEGSAIAEFDSGYEDRYMSSQFMAVFRPVATGYLFRSQYGELLYMAKAAFEAKFTKSAGTPTAWGDVTGKPATFTPTIGTTATTAMAGNKTPTTTDRGGVLQQAAEAAIPAQTVTDIAGAQASIATIVTKVNSILTKLKVGGELA